VEFYLVKKKKSESLKKQKKTYASFLFLSLKRSYAFVENYLFFGLNAIYIYIY